MSSGRGMWKSFPVRFLHQSPCWVNGDKGNFLKPCVSALPHQRDKATLNFSLFYFSASLTGDASSGKSNLFIHFSLLTLQFKSELVLWKMSFTF
jgi:hypothetical protein